MTRIKDSLYFKYVKEREGAEVLECDTGFIIYRIFGKELFIKEMWIEPALRSTVLLRNLIMQLDEIAKKADCEIMTATIYLSDKMGSKTMSSALRMGFGLARADNEKILIVKDLRS